MDKRTVSDWIVVIADQAVREAASHEAALDQKKTRERFRPWHTDKRLTVRMRVSLAEAIKKTAGTDAKSSSLWIARAVQHAIEARGIKIP